MNGSLKSSSARPLDPADTNVSEKFEADVEYVKQQSDESAEKLGLSERVKTEVRNRLRSLEDDLLEEGDSDAEILEQEEVVRGTRGLGSLWKLSLWITVSFAAYMLLSGARIESKWLPNLTERERIPRIYRPRRNRQPSSSSG